MPGRGKAPKAPENRRTRHKPQLGEWKASPGVGWQHGPIPAPPDGLVEASRAAWDTWMKAWWASNWTPADLPGLRLVITQFDAHQRNAAPKANDATAVVRLMDTYGITPAGQQARRWTPPKAEPDEPKEAADNPYGHLRRVV